MHPKQIGEISEALVVAKLLKLGYVVSKPYGDNAPYDLIVETNAGDLRKIQVKTFFKSKGALVVNFRKVRINTKLTNISFYNTKDVDYFAAVDQENDRVSHLLFTSKMI